MTRPPQLGSSRGGHTIRQFCAPAAEAPQEPTWHCAGSAARPDGTSCLVLEVGFDHYRAGGTATYKVCQTGSTTTCSNQVTATW